MIVVLSDEQAADRIRALMTALHTSNEQMAALRKALDWYEELKAYRGIMGEARVIGAAVVEKVRSLVRSLESP